MSFTHRGAACQSYSLASLECLEQDYLKDSAAEPFTFTLEVPLAKEAGGQVAVPDSAEVVEAPTTTVRPQHSLTHLETRAPTQTYLRPCLCDVYGACSCTACCGTMGSRTIGRATPWPL